MCQVFGCCSILLKERNCILYASLENNFRCFYYGKKSLGLALPLVRRKQTCKKAAALLVMGLSLIKENFHIMFAALLVLSNSRTASA